MVQLLIWLAVRRSIEATDVALSDTRRRLHDLETQRLQGIEEELRQVVKRAECEKEHARLGCDLKKGADRMYETALKLQEVAAETKRSLEWLRQMQEDQTSAKQDLDRLWGEIKGRQ
jgi:hypothetical protein